MSSGETRIPTMRDRARERLARLRASSTPNEPDEVRELRASGWILIGNLVHGYVMLPPERD